MKAELESERSFCLEAGAGAGKTYSLIAGLQYLIDNKRRQLSRRSQQIACITYTNVAREEILGRISNNPIVRVDTIHSFCWSVLRLFQPELRSYLGQLGDNWVDRLESSLPVVDQTVEYNLGYPGIFESEVTLHHDDVVKLMSLFLDRPKFVQLLAARFPILLIDEYQDTNIDLAKSIVANLVERDSKMTVGFFGDHWQKIYGTRSVGDVSSLSSRLTLIPKGANFRSRANLVAAFSRMRPQLTQAPSKPDLMGEIHVFHTNHWVAQRQSGAHWKGDLPSDLARKAVAMVLGRLDIPSPPPPDSGVKVLMLTNGLLAQEQGYRSIHEVFHDRTEDYLGPEDPYLAYLVGTVEPLCLAHEQGRFGEMFSLIGRGSSGIEKFQDKRIWNSAMAEIVQLRNSGGSIGSMLELINKQKLLRISSKIEETEKLIARFDTLEPEEKAKRESRVRRTSELKLISYSEVVGLTNYISTATPYGTKHGSKGAEFDTVLVVLGRGWNQYNWNQFLEQAAGSVPVDSKELAAYERNRNLFYVSCTRAKRRLALLFTQELSGTALSVLERWFGKDCCHPLESN